MTLKNFNEDLYKFTPDRHVSLKIIITTIVITKNPFNLIKTHVRATTLKNANWILEK